VPQLPIFSGFEVRCIKCGNDWAFTKYVGLLGLCGCAKVPNEMEHMHRECSTCGYMWDEAVLTDASLENIKAREQQNPLHSAVVKIEARKKR
jgi:predicted nucleic-acid-binding Zn-ribbon protein